MHVKCWLRVILNFCSCIRCYMLLLLPKQLSQGLVSHMLNIRRIWKLNIAMAMFSARRRLFDIYGEFLISCTKSCGIKRIAFLVPVLLIYLCTYLLITHHSSTTLFNAVWTAFSCHFFLHSNIDLPSSLPVLCVCCNCVVCCAVCDACSVHWVEFILFWPNTRKRS